jgi:phosphoglycerate dehydrogenase-like enzyme
MRPTLLSVIGAILLASVAPARQPAPDATAEAIGSLRNARIAFPMEGERAPLTFIASGLSEAQVAELASLAPNLSIINASSRQEALEHAPKAHGADARFASAEFIAMAPNLVWVQSPSAGVERLVAMPGLADNDRIVVTNMRAAHAPAIADHAFAMLLSLTRNMRPLHANQVRGLWSDGDPAPRPIALAGRTMLVVGLGGIGGEVAQRAHGFGMRVFATRRTDTPAPDYVERIGKPDDLLAMLPEADVVAICLPLTTETEKLFNAAAFEAMKPGAYLINVGRGRIVDTPALVNALESGRLAGACLDVTDPEPLPPDHPLWKMPTVVISPHISSDSEETDRRRWALFRENIRRFAAGEPLLNVVDKSAGY